MQVENECKVTEIFCIIDDFCKEFSKIEQKKAFFDGKRHRNKPSRMSDATLPASVPESGILQPLCGIGKRCDGSTDSSCI